MLLQANLLSNDLFDFNQGNSARSIEIKRLKACNHPLLSDNVFLTNRSHNKFSKSNEPILIIVHVRKHSVQLYLRHIFEANSPEGQQELLSSQVAISLLVNGVENLLVKIIVALTEQPSDHVD